nr:MAG TPA: virulence protein [Caudoviricetes sp.]
MRLYASCQRLGMPQNHNCKSGKVLDRNTWLYRVW